MATKLFRKLQVTQLSADFRTAVKIVQSPLEKPAPGKVLIKNHFAGVNASDINVSAGRYMTDGRLPFDIGFEGLGTIEELGPDSTQLQKGQPVLYIGRGGFSEYIYAHAKELLPVPDLKPEYIVSLACGLTAAIGLSESGRIKSGEKVLITAAAGGTGHIAVQWAKRAGCFVIGTTSTSQKADYLTSIGVDHVINYRQQDLHTVLKQEYPKGIDVIWETIGGQTFEVLVKHLAMHGRLLIIGGTTGYKTVGLPAVDMTNLPARLLMGSQSLIGFNLINAGRLYPKYWPQLVDLITKQEIKVKVDMGEGTSEGKFTGVDDAIRAVEYLHTGRSEGKVIVQIQ